MDNMKPHRAQTSQRGRGGSWRNKKSFKGGNGSEQTNDFNSFHPLPNGGQHPSPNKFFPTSTGLSGTALPFVPANAIVQPITAVSTVPSNIAPNKAVDLPPQSSEVTATPGYMGRIIEVDVPITCLRKGASAAPPAGVLPSSLLVDAKSATLRAVTMPNTPVTRAASLYEKPNAEPVVPEQNAKSMPVDLIENMMKFLPQEKRRSFHKRVAIAINDLAYRQLGLQQKRSEHNSAYIFYYEREQHHSKHQMRHHDEVVHNYSLVVQSSGNQKRYHEENVLNHMRKVQECQKNAADCRKRVEDARMSIEVIDQALIDIISQVHIRLINVFAEEEMYKFEMAEQVCEENEARVAADEAVNAKAPQQSATSTISTEKPEILTKLEIPIAGAAKKKDVIGSFGKPEPVTAQSADPSTAEHSIANSGSDDPSKPATKAFTENIKKNELHGANEGVMATGSIVLSEEVVHPTEDAGKTDGEAVQKTAEDMDHNNSGNNSSQAITKNQPKKKSKNKNKNKNKSSGAKTQGEQTIYTTANNTGGNAQEETNQSSRRDSALETSSNAGSSVISNANHGRKHSREMKPRPRTASQASRSSSGLGGNSIQLNGKTIRENKEAARARKAANVGQEDATTTMENQTAVRTDRHSSTDKSRDTKATHTRKGSSNFRAYGSKTAIVEEKAWTNGKKMIVTENLLNGEREALVITNTEHASASPPVGSKATHGKKKSSDYKVGLEGKDLGDGKLKHKGKWSDKVSQEKLNSTHEGKDMSGNTAHEAVEPMHEDNKQAQSPSHQKTWAQRLGENTP